MVALLALLLASCCYGEFLRIEFEVREMDCDHCRQSLTNRLKRIKGVANARLDPLNNSALIELRPGNTVKFERIRDQIREAGFTPKNAKVVLAGRPVTSAGKWRIVVTGPDQEYSMAVPETLISSLAARDNKQTRLEGLMSPPPDPKTEPVLEVRKVGDPQ